MRISPSLAASGRSIFSANRVNTPLWSQCNPLEYCLESSLPMMLSTSITSKIQTIGENVFIAALIIAAIQGAMVIYEYRSDPEGELIVPPGATWGVETGERKEEEVMEAPPLTQLKAAQNEAMAGGKRWKQAINKWLVLLLPWLARQWSFWMVRNTHLLHFGFVMSLATVFDVFRRWDLKDEDNGPDILSDSSSPYHKLLVIGDSLACGIGCANVRDKRKNQFVPMDRIENISPPQTSRTLALLSTSQTQPDVPPPGPVFPRVLAHTLSLHLHKPVYWRSAGVDGGTVRDISTHCLDVIREEVSLSRPPDVVVLLCGSNDLKKILTPFHPSTAFSFRGDLIKTVKEIRGYAPRAKIVLPALPTYRIDKNSVVNIFPLVFFLDLLLGCWDYQKKIVADHSPNILYVGLTAKDIYTWYKKRIPGQDTTLIASDGVHPNARCYSKWAECVGEKIWDTLSSQRRLSITGNHKDKS